MTGGRNKILAALTVSCILSGPWINISSSAQDKPLTQESLSQKAEALTKKVIEEGRLVDLINPEKVYNLPIGIGKKIGDLMYTIVLDELTFTPTGVVANAYMSLGIPGSGKQVGLMAENVRISVNGIEAARLRLLTDLNVPLPGNNTMVLEADSTYVEFDCNGYKSTSLSAAVSLDEKVFVKEDPESRTPVEGEKVTGRISATVSDMNDILLGMTLDPFQLKSLNGFSFYPGDVYFDMSDTRNPEDIEFPEDYNSVLTSGSEESLWRGVWISEMKIALPKSFSKGESSTTISANDFICDLEGLTGSISITTPLLRLDQGNLGGWQFSVNKFSLSLVKSSFSEFLLAGDIVVPVNKNTPLEYTATLDNDNNYVFKVTLPGSLTAPLFGSGSSLTIGNNSYISVAYRDGEFYPKAVLNGNLKVVIPGSSGVTLADCAFQEMTIQRENPEFDVKSFSMTTGTMAGFPVEIKKIELAKRQNDIGFDFFVNANLMKEKITGASEFVIWISKENGTNNWAYKDLEFRGIKVDANMGAVALKGELISYRDNEVFGNGYYGSIYMSVLPGITAEATAQFGNIAGMRYWYADASLKLATGIVIAPGLGIYGFGGGAYYHMTQTIPTSVVMSEKIDSKVPEIGTTRSGITYKPDESVFLGVKAKVFLGTTPSPKAFNGDATLGIEITSSFGLKQLYFQGNGQFMSDPNKVDAAPKVKGSIRLDYLPEKKELSGSAEIYISVANAVKGTGANNRAGRADFLFSPSEWHIYIGTPTDPVQVTLVNLYKATSYMMVGTEIPDFPPLPQQVAPLAAKMNLNNLSCDNLTSGGGGFAFGATLRVSTGPKTYLIFYGNFDMGMGFDLMLKDYGTDARCEGFTGPLGINGWYAKGQAWAYIDGDVGITVKIFGSRKNIKILDIGAAAVLAAQLPNPTFITGAVDGRYSVLGGLVKGTCHFEFSVGDQCKLTNVSEVEGISVITSIEPDAGDSDIDVFVSPQVVFNMPVDQEFKVIESNQGTRSYRVTMDYFRVMNGDAEIAAKTQWNSSKDVIALKPVEILPAKKSLKATIKVHFEVYNNNKWEKYLVAGKEQSQVKEITFITGDPPPVLTDNNVQLTYPVRNMVNFYKQEYSKCFIQTLQSVKYLFPQEGSWSYVGQFTASSGTLSTPVTYNDNTKRIEMDVPANLINNTVYKLRIMKVPAGNNQSPSVELYSYYFRTSTFNTFAAKMNSFRVENRQSTAAPGIGYIRVNLFDSEFFDAYEIKTIEAEAILDNKWYAENYRGLIYDNYGRPPVNQLSIGWRSVTPVGIPPARSVFLLQNGSKPELSAANISSGTFRFETGITAYIDYQLSYYVMNDYQDLKTQALAKPQNTAYRAIRDSRAIGFSPDTYSLKLKYYVPGVSTPTTEYITRAIYQ